MSAVSRRELRGVLEEALTRLAPQALVHAHVDCAAGPQGPELRLGGRVFLLRQFCEVVVLALGKASLGMASALCEVVSAAAPSAVLHGCVVTNEPEALSSSAARALPDRMEVMAGDHPTPGPASFRAGARLLQLAASVRDREDVLVLFAVSGGASALAESPVSWVAEQELADLHGQLVRCGATIAEINAVRRVCSRIKGGGLAAAVGSTAAASVLLSDVNPGDVVSLGSGPTMVGLWTPPSGLVFSDLFERYGLTGSPAVARQLAAGLGEASRTAAGPCPPHVVVGDNRTAVEAVAHAARCRGLEAQVDEALMATPEVLVSTLATCLAASAPQVSSAHLVVSGGEPVCPVSGPGVGGRSLELALRVAVELDASPRSAGMTFLAAGTDGVDGNSPAAGAVVDHKTVSRARALGFDVRAQLAASDAYPLFEALGDAVSTGGPTGTNLRDVHLRLHQA